MKLGFQVYGLDRVRDQMAKLSGSALRGAYAAALNDTAFQKVVPGMREETRKFNQVTPFIERAPRVVQKATPEKLEAIVAPTYWSALGTKGGKIGVDPQMVLQAQQFGGRRADKRSESALRRVGILPMGYQTAVPATPFPGSVDSYGNIKGAFVQQLLSYLQAYRLAGDSGNMKAAAMRRLAQGGSKARLAKVAGPNLGRRYFVSYGKLRGGSRLTAKGEADGRAGNLAPGVWAVLGNSGAVVRPVLMFVRPGMYKPRVDLEAVRNSAEVREHLGRRLRYRIRQAAGV